MNSERSGRLVILSGPSCVGKSPLANLIPEGEGEGVP
jgi:guanylate kinase